MRTVNGPRTLGEAALDTILAEGLDHRDLLWDSWRRPDGRWVVVASVLTDEGEIRGSWIYDTTGRTAHPQDDAARWLMGASDEDFDQVMAQQTVILPTAPTGRPRLVSIPEPPPPRVAPRAIVEPHVPRAVSRVGPAPVPDDEYDDYDEGIEGADVNKGPFDDDIDSYAETDDVEAYADESPSIATRRVERPVDPTAYRDVRRPAERPPASTGRRPTPLPRQPAPAAKPAPRSAPAAQAPPSPSAMPPRAAKGKGKRRASVPTWDEILFGATRNDDN